MLKNFQERTYEDTIEREVVFDDGVYNGFGFPCDEYGIPLPECPPAAIKNYYWCLNHPKSFVRYNKIIEIKRKTYNPAHGTCSCGEEIYIDGNGYYGAWECPACGKWYNAFGQELLPPERWEEDMNEDY